jgi:hypothetical protein
LQIGVVGGLGLTLGQFFSLQARGEQSSAEIKEATAKSVIHIFLPGGMAHQESFDPKPDAPIEYRGEMGSIETKLSGVRFNELLKQTAQVADKITVCRSMTHGEAAHERGTANMFTGYRPSPALVYPSWGSVVSHEFGPRENLPPYVCIPNQGVPDAGSGYLSSSYGPFSLGADPGDRNFSVRDLNLPGGVDDARFASRRGLLEVVNQHFGSLEKSDKLTAMDTFYDRAYRSLVRWETREQQQAPPYPLWVTLGILSRSIWRQGIRSSYRSAYWRFLFQILSRWSRNGPKLNMGIMLLVSGHHFIPYARTVADQLEAELRKHDVDQAASVKGFSRTERKETWAIPPIRNDQHAELIPGRERVV